MICYVIGTLYKYDTEAGCLKRESRNIYSGRKKCSGKTEVTTQMVMKFCSRGTKLADVIDLYQSFDEMKDYAFFGR